MQKILFNKINLSCYMQEATEINEHECHKGVMSMDDFGQLRFEENAGDQPRLWKRNPKLFKGNYINMARRKDGRLMFVFKQIDTTSPNFSPESYAFCVYCEIANALKSIK